MPYERAQPAARSDGDRPRFSKGENLRGHVRSDLRQGLLELSASFGAKHSRTEAHGRGRHLLYDDLDVLRSPPPSPLYGDVIRADHDKELYDWFVETDRYGPAGSITLREAMVADDRHFFDREPGWPLHAKRKAVLATEHVIVESPTAPEMVKIVFTLARPSGLSLAERALESSAWRAVRDDLTTRLVRPASINISRELVMKG